MMRYAGKAILFLTLVGLLTFASVRYGFGRLPGDIVVDRGNGIYFYAPFTTAILVSLMLTLLFRLLGR
jgi:hypothetical protein